uniref:SET domain-containing protein n=2 Tax=Panagrellus redivivus TaxID=6233 RepID=A0A7E4VUS2_PANRE
MDDNSDNPRGTPTEIVPTKRARMTSPNTEEEVADVADEFDQHLTVTDPSASIAARALAKQNKKIVLFDDIFYSPGNRAVGCRIENDPAESALVPTNDELTTQFLHQHLHIPDCSFQVFTSDWYNQMSAYFIAPSNEDPETIDADFALLQAHSDHIERIYEHVDDGILDTHARITVDPKEDSFFSGNWKFPSVEALSDHLQSALMEDATLVPVCNIDYNVASSDRATRPPRAPIFLPDNNFYSHTATISDGRTTYIDKRSRIYFTILSPDAVSQVRNEAHWEPKGKPNFEKEFERFHSYLEYLDYTPVSFCYVNQSIVKSAFRHYNPDLLLDNTTRFLTYKHYDNDEWTRWMLDVVEQSFRGDYESEVNRFSEDILNLIGGVDRLDLATAAQNPFTGNEDKANVERLPCKGLAVRHSRNYNARPVPLKFRGAISNFEFSVQDKPYLNKPAIEEALNSLCLRYALRRWDANNDDSFANYFFQSLFQAGPNRFLFFEVLRMLFCAKNSLCTQEVTILMEVQKTFDEPQSSYHLMLALNHLRSKNFELMEEEIYNYTYAIRYGLRIFHTPFTDNYEDFYDMRLDMNFHLNYAAMLSITLNLAGVNNIRAYELAQNMINFETHPTSLDDAQFALALYVQTKLKVLNIYDYSDEGSLFSANSDFAKFATTLNLFELETISENYISDMQVHYNKETKALSRISLLIHRYLMAECLSLAYYTISGKHEASEDMKVVEGRLEHYSYWTIFNTAVNSVMKVVARSHALAAGNLICPRGLPVFDDFRAILPDRHEVPAEALVCEVIANAYEYAYTGMFEEALHHLNMFRIQYGNYFVGSNNLRVAYDTLCFDACFFIDAADEDDVQDALDDLYVTCPIEGLFRESQWQMFSGTVSKKNVQRLMWIRNVCVQSKLYPLIQVRATILLGQSMIAEAQYDMAIKELNTAKELATHFGYEALLFAINRRIASALFLSGQHDAATELLEKCHPDDGRVALPEIEIGLYHYLLFRCYELKLNAPESDDKPSIHMPIANVSAILVDALVALERYLWIYHAVLVEAMEYCRVIESEPVLDEDGNEAEFNSHALEAIHERFDEVFPLLSLNFTRPKDVKEFEKIKIAHKRNIPCL